MARYNCDDGHDGYHAKPDLLARSIMKMETFWLTATNMEATSTFF